MAKTTTSGTSHATGTTSQQQQQQTTGYQTGTQAQQNWQNMLGQFASTSSPFLTQQYKPMEQMLINMIMQRLKGPGGLPPGYEEMGLRHINEGSTAARQAVMNRLSGIGMGRGPAVGAAMAPIEIERTGRQIDFRTMLPLLARQMQAEDLGLAANLMSGFGKGMSTAGTQSQQQTGGMTGQSSMNMGSNMFGTTTGQSTMDQSQQQTSQTKKSLFENMLSLAGLGAGLFAPIPIGGGG